MTNSHWLKHCKLGKVTWTRWSSTAATSFCTATTSVCWAVISDCNAACWQAVTHNFETTLNNIETTLRQLWTILRQFWDNFEQYWDNFEKILRQLWTVLGQLWDNFEQVWNNFFGHLRLQRCLSTSNYQAVINDLCHTHISHIINKQISYKLISATNYEISQPSGSPRQSPWPQDHCWLLEPARSEEKTFLW